MWSKVQDHFLSCIELTLINQGLEDNEASEELPVVADIMILTQQAPEEDEASSDEVDQD